MDMVSYLMGKAAARRSGGGGGGTTITGFIGEGEHIWYEFPLEEGRLKIDGDGETVSLDKGYLSYLNGVFTVFPAKTIEITSNVGNADHLLRGISPGAEAVKVTGSLQGSASYCFGAFDCDTLDVSGLSLNAVTTFEGMFGGFTGKKIILPKINSEATSFSLMFHSCKSLEEITGLGDASFLSDKYVNFSSFLRNSDKLTEITLPKISETGSGLGIMYMFYNCTALKTIYAGVEWDSRGKEKPSSSKARPFIGCYALVGGAGTVFDSVNTNVEMAHIDTAENPGYFTLKEA